MIILSPLVLLTLTYGIDTLLISKASRIPIYAYGIKSGNHIKTYNSFFYRMYDCNGNLTLDYGYKKNFVCDPNLLTPIDINDLLNEPTDSFQDYHHRFVRVHGKISKISGVESLELALYTKTNNSLNGFVSFNLNYKILVNTKEELSKYRIYDFIDVVGRVDSLTTKDGVTTITLQDTVLIPSNIYDEYSFEVVNNENAVLTNLVKEKDYYYYGISSLNIKYEMDNIYELAYLLTDNRLTWNDLITNNTYEVLKNNEDEELAKKYSFEKYNLLDCANGKKIVANKNLSIDQETCNLELS